MRILTVILLFFSLSAKAQDTVTYAQFKTAMINMETIRPVKFIDNPVFKPMVMLGATFIVNTIVGNAMYKNKDNPTMLGMQNEKIMMTTFTIYITGATLALLLFFIEI